LAEEFPQTPLGHHFLPAAFLVLDVVAFLALAGLKGDGVPTPLPLRPSVTPWLAAVDLDAPEES
jgi:hypothetical protein